MVTGEALAFHAFFLLEIPVRIVKKLANRSDAGTLSTITDKKAT
jgi:hypothetical protein